MTNRLERTAEEAFDGPLRVLMVCYHFPPMSTTGSLRAARFVKYMPSDVAVEVLTVAHSLEPRANVELAEEVLGHGAVHRAPLNRLVGQEGTERVLSRPGSGALTRLLAKIVKTFLAWFVWIPDRNVAWIPGAVRVASRLLAERRVHVLFSTSPPHSAHLLAAHLARRHQLPWVVDFRDPWADNLEGHWPTPLHRAFAARLERAVLRRATVVLVNTPGNRRRMLEAAPELDPAAVHVLTNGFDPERRPAPAEPAQARVPGQPLRLLHAGHLYDGSENTFHALAQLLDHEPDLVRGVRLRLLGTLDPGMRRLAESLARAGMVELVDPVPADRVPAELARADALLYVVNPAGPHWVPSKLYEYLAAEKPVIAVLPRGDAWDILEASGMGLLLEDTGDVPALADGLAVALGSLMKNEVRLVPNREVISRYDGRKLTLRLAELLRQAAGRPSAASPVPPQARERGLT